MPPLLPSALLETLAAHADEADTALDFPEASWAALRDSGILNWGIPTDLGGAGFSHKDHLVGHGLLGGACLTTAFILSQREAAVRRLRDCANQSLREEWLPALAHGESFATVGISQLTTSRQHTQPALAASWQGDDLVLNGEMPWVTAAAKADAILAGAPLPDGRQILALVPRATPGVEVMPALDLLAVRGSLTAEVQCRDVFVDRRNIVAGPAQQVLAGKSGGTGGLETSCLALGLARSAIDWIQKEGENRPELKTIADSFNRAWQPAHAELLRLAEVGSSPQAAGALRGRANRLVLRVTQAALAAGKGTGFVHPHPAQRWARQALFFLVWSCPRPAAEATFAFLACDD